MKRSREEEQFIDLDQLRDLWGLIQPWLSADDLKNLRLASREIEQRIRRAYFSRFRVRLTQASFAQFRPELAPFITKVDDTESGGRLALWLSRAQHNSALKDVLIDADHIDHSGLDWNSLTQIDSLEVLDAGVLDTQVTLPESITNLSNLQTFSFGGIEPNSGLIELSESISKLTNLEKLFLTNNLLSTLPESFGNLKNLRILELQSNQFQEIPEVVMELSKLEELDFVNNYLIALPETIGQLSNLRGLDCSENSLNSIPNSITQLSNLQVLWLSFNQLTALPESIGQLTNLQRLILFENELVSVPDSLFRLSKLQYLALGDNRLPEATEERLRQQFGNKVWL